MRGEVDALDKNRGKEESNGQRESSAVAKRAIIWSRVTRCEEERSRLHKMRVSDGQMG